MATSKARPRRTEFPYGPAGIRESAGPRAVATGRAESDREHPITAVIPNRIGQLADGRGRTGRDNTGISNAGNLSSRNATAFDHFEVIAQLLGLSGIVPVEELLHAAGDGRYDGVTVIA